MSTVTSPQRRLKRRRRVRAKVRGTAERPRISVFRSNRGIVAQLVDDEAGRTLAAVNWTEADLRDLKPMEQATQLGKTLAQRARTQGSSAPCSIAAVSPTSCLELPLTITRVGWGTSNSMPSGALIGTGCE